MQRACGALWADSLPTTTSILIANADNRCHERRTLGMVWRSTHACRVHGFRHDPLSVAACRPSCQPATSQTIEAARSCRNPYPLSPISSARNISAIAAAMPAGDIAPARRAEIAKVIDGYVKAFQIAELDERTARVLSSAAVDVGNHPAPSAVGLHLRHRLGRAVG